MTLEGPGANFSEGSNFYADLILTLVVGLFFSGRHSTTFLSVARPRKGTPQLRITRGSSLPLTRLWLGVYYLPEP